MSLGKKIIILFSSINGQDLLKNSTPSISKLIEKGAVLSNVICQDNFKTVAGAGNSSGETIWEATDKTELTVANSLDEAFDLCIVDIENNTAAIEQTVSKALELCDRQSLLILATKSVFFYYGFGITKAHKIDTELDAATLAPTVAYLTNLPLPSNCDAKIVYGIFKDINLKMKEIQKLEKTIASLEFSIEKAQRKPWDKHDCA